MIDTELFMMEIKGYLTGTVLTLYSSPLKQNKNSPPQTGYTNFFSNKFLIINVFVYSKKITSLNLFQIYFYLQYLWFIQASLMALGICFSMYALLMPGILSKTARQKVLLECLLFFLVTILYFIGGEVLASCDVSWKSTLLNSFWYNCSRRTQKLIPLLILKNQDHEYLCFKGVIPCNFYLMQRVIKLGYSCYNFLRIRNLKSRFGH